MIKNKLWLLILLFGVFSGGIAGAEKQVFEYTGADQTFTVPDGVSQITIKAWGGGSSGQLNPGGAGGYSAGTIAVTPGEEFAVMVGQGGDMSEEFTALPQSYGFGGGTNSLNRAGQGGGLSGVFTSTGAITATSQGRAVVVAGGGGGGDDPVQAGVPGTPGNQNNSANTDSIGVQGTHGTSFQGAGGGGYLGGDQSQGGTGFVIATATDAEILAGNGITPPKQDDPDYVAGVAVGIEEDVDGSDAVAGNGLVVIEWQGNQIDINVNEEGTDVIEITCTEDCEHDFDGDLSRLCVNLVCNADSPEVITATLNFSTETITKEKQCDKVPPVCTATFWGPDEWHNLDDFSADPPLECVLQSYEDTTGEALELNTGEDDEPPVGTGDVDIESLTEAFTGVQIETNTVEIKAGQQSGRATCPAETVVLGGYCRTIAGNQKYNPSGYERKIIGQDFECRARHDAGSVGNINEPSDMTVGAVCGIKGTPSEGDPVLERIQVEKNTVEIKAGQQNGRATCPAETVVLGGYCRTIAGNEKYNPSGYERKIIGQDFECRARHDAGSVGNINESSDMTVGAICGVITDPAEATQAITNVQIERNTVEVKAGEQSGRATCPAGTVVMGGYCRTIAGQGRYNPSGYETRISGQDYICRARHDRDSAADEDVPSDMTIGAVCGVISRGANGGNNVNNDDNSEDTQCLLEPGSVEVIDPLEPIDGDICTFQVCDKSGNCSTCDSPELKYDNTPVCVGGENGGIGKTADGALCGECHPDDDDCLCIKGDESKCRDGGPINCYTNPFHDRCPGFQNPACLIDPFTPGCPVVNPCYPTQVYDGVVCPRDAIRFCSRNPYHYGCNVACSDGSIGCDPVPPGQ